MPIPVTCACGTSLLALDELFGQKIHCSNCGALLAVLPALRSDSLTAVAPPSPPLPARLPAFTPTSYPSPNPLGLPSVVPHPTPAVPVAGYQVPEQPKTESPLTVTDAYGVTAAPVPTRPLPFTYTPPSSLSEQTKGNAPSDTDTGSSGYGFVSTYAGVMGGIAMMIVAVLWFAIEIAAADRIYLYPPVLFVLGIAAVIKGLARDN